MKEKEAVQDVQPLVKKEKDIENICNNTESKNTSKSVPKQEKPNNISKKKSKPQSDAKNVNDSSVKVTDKTAVKKEEAKVVKALKNKVKSKQLSTKFAGSNVEFDS